MIWSPCRSRQVLVALPVVALDGMERADGDDVVEVVVGVAIDGDRDRDIVTDGGLKAREHVGVEAPVVVDGAEADAVCDHARTRGPASRLVGAVPEQERASHDRAVRRGQRHLKAAAHTRGLHAGRARGVDAGEVGVVVELLVQDRELCVKDGLLVAGVHHSVLLGLCR
jgi:hypothetical protein